MSLASAFVEGSAIEHCFERAQRVIFQRLSLESRDEEFAARSSRHLLCQDINADDSELDEFVLEISDADPNFAELVCFTLTVGVLVFAAYGKKDMSNRLLDSVLYQRMSENFRAPAVQRYERLLEEAGSTNARLVERAIALREQCSMGERALNSGDYGAALLLWQPPAESGIPGAQFNLGLLYHLGRGVQQDYSQAAKWYRLAAEQGHTNAQENLGALFFTKNLIDGGIDGAPRDAIEAYVWFDVAMRAGSKDDRGIRAITAFMTPSEIDFAKDRSRAWRRKKRHALTRCKP